MTAVAAVGMHYLRYDYNLLNLQPVGLECVELEHKLFDQTNRSAWFALSMADTPEEVAAKKEEFLRLPSVERVVEVATKLPADVEQKRPIIERIHQRLANLPHQVPEIPVTPHAELDRMLAAAQGDALVAVGRRPGRRRTATTARHAAADPARRIYPPRPRVSANDGRRSARAAAQAAGRVDAPAAAVGRPARKRRHALRRQDRPLLDAGLQQGQYLGRGADGAIRLRRAERRSRGHRQPAASLRGLAAHEAEFRAGRLVRPAGDHPRRAVGLPPAQPHLVGGAAHGRRPVANARADGAAGHPARTRPT